MKGPAIDQSNRCSPRFVYESQYGCPVFSATAWIRWIGEHPWVIGVALILFGLLSTFKGKELFQVTVGILGAGLTFLVMMLLFSIWGALDYLDNQNGSLAQVVLAVCTSVILAALIGFLLYKAGWMIGVIAIGAIAGFFLGVTVYNLIFFTTNALWLLITLTIISTVGFAFLAFKKHEHIMVFGTAFIGSYAFVRGVSLFLGHYPSEVQIYAELSSGVHPKFEWEFYVYLVAIVIMFIGGATYQLKKQEKEQQEYKKLE